jgi:catechol 2,3-dioxygenase-like lactoylglutathione lyase family enzyme
MMAETFWHIAVLVRDLEAAIEKFSRVLNIEFREPTVAETPGMYEDGEVKTTSLRLAFSIDGPPYYELIESAGTGMFGNDQPEGVHHIGVWNPDNSAEMERLRELGLEAAACNFLPDGCLQTLFNRPEDLHGCRIEYVNSTNRASIESFITTGKYLE